MTDFGKHFWPSLLRIRVLGSAFALAVASLVQLFLPAYPLQPVLIVLAFEFAVSLLVGGSETRLSPPRVVHATLVIDTAVITALVFYMGGIQAGFASLYAWIVISAAVLLGLRWTPFYAAVALTGFTIALGLEALGIRAPGALPQPPLITLFSQLTLLAILIVFAYLIGNSIYGIANRLRQEQVESAAREEEAERGRRRWELINRVSLRIQESVKPEEIYATIGEELGSLQLHCAMLQWDERNESLRLAYVSIEAQLVEFAEATLKIKRDTHSIPLTEFENIRRSIETRAPVFVEDALAAAPRTTPDIPRSELQQVLEKWNVKRIIYAPMVAGERVIGILTVWGERLDANDIPTLAALAHQAASALEKATLLAQAQKRASQLELVSLISARAAAIHDAQGLMEQVVAMVTARFGYQFAAIMLIDPARDELYAAAAAGLLTQRVVGSFRESLDVGIIGHVARTGETQLARDVRTDEHYVFLLAGDDPVRSELAVPLRRGSEIVGVLDLESTEVDAFDASDVAAMETLADQIGTTIESARLLAAETRRAEELEAARQASLALTAERDLEVLLRSILERAVQLLHAQAGALYTLDAAGGELTCQLSYNLPHDFTGIRLNLGEGLAGKVAAQGEPIFVHDYQSWEGRATHLWNEPLSAVMGIPLKWQGRVLGVINLHRDEFQPRFSDADLRLANLFAAQAAAALENARLLSQVQSQLQAQQALTMLSRELLETLDSDAILQRVVTSAVSALKVDGALVLLPDERDELIVRAEYGWGQEIIGQAVPLSAQSETGRAMLTRQPARWNDGQVLAASSAAPLPSAHGFLAGLAVPMVSGDTSVGVIALSTRLPRAFSDYDVQKLSLLANQTAIALERVHYFDQVQRSVRELNLLFESHRATSSTLEPEQVIARLLEQLTRSLDVTSAYFVTVVEPDDRMDLVQEFFARAATPRERLIEEQTSRLSDHPLVRRMLANGPTVSQRTDLTLSAGERRSLEEGDGQTVLRVPMRTANQLIGYVTLWESRAPRVWSEREVRFVQTMASHAAEALANARLYQDTRNRSRELEALYQASLRFNSSLALDEIFDSSADALCDVLGYDHVSIYLYQAQALHLQVQRGFETPIETISLDRGIVARAARTGQTIFLPTVDADPEFIAAASGLQSEIAVPLVHGDEVLGVLNVESSKPQLLTLADLRLLGTFANQLVLAIENGRLYRDARRRLREAQTLYEFTSSLGQVLDPEELGRRALDSVARLTDFDIAEVSLVDESSGMIIPLAFAGRDLSHDLATSGFRAALHSHSLRRGMGVSGWVAEHGEAVRLGDVTRDSRYLTLSPRVRSEICVPLRAGAQVIGVINLESERYDAFDEHAEQILTTFANQLAVAFMNARLYGQTKRDAEVKAALLRELSHRVKNNLAAIASLLYLALDEPPESRQTVLMETLGRVQSMVAAHTLLARSDRARVNLLDLGRQVVEDTVRQLSPRGCVIQLSVEGEAVEVSPRQITTFALLLNELATNAIQHGFAHALRSSPGQLCLRVERYGYGATLSLEDNGAGLPAGFVLGASPGVGLNLVRTLVEKDLQGVFELERRGDWTRAVVHFLVEA